MKKLLFFLFYMSTLYAQFELSTFGGPGLSNCYNVRFPIKDTYYGVAVNAGITAQYNFDEINSIKIEVGYNRKGYIYFYDHDLEYPQLNYITLSPMAQFNVSAKVKIYFTIGPYLGFLINKDPSREVFDAGAQLGIGYKLPLYKNKLSVFIEAKEQIGLINNATKGNGYAGNHSFNVVAGLAWKF